MTNSTTYRIAFFISPHGYGHASRASAIMAALQNSTANFRFEIFTKVPNWFFTQTLETAFGYHALLTDIGVVQVNSMVEDLPETVKQLNDFLPFDPALIKSLARQVIDLNCELVVCDIAPMGIAVAQAAGIPSMLIENFTWDWIYEGYPQYREQLQPHGDYLRQLTDSVDYHIQTIPVCLERDIDLTSNIVRRTIKTKATQIRAALGIPQDAQVVMMSMGGLNWDYSFLNRLESMANIYLLAAGNIHQTEQRDHLILLARNSGFFHPDLVNAVDAVIGKTGYSTIAEVYQAGIPFGYVSRPNFREAPIMEEFILAEMQARPITEAELYNNNWLSKVPSLLALPRIKRNAVNGADQIAEFIWGIL